MFARGATLPFRERTRCSVYAGATLRWRPFHNGAGAVTRDRSVTPRVSPGNKLPGQQLFYPRFVRPVSLCYGIYSLRVGRLRSLQITLCSHSCLSVRHLPSVPLIAARGARGVPLPESALLFPLPETNVKHPVGARRRAASGAQTARQMRRVWLAPEAEESPGAMRGLRPR